MLCPRNLVEEFDRDPQAYVTQSYLGLSYTNRDHHSFMDKVENREIAIEADCLPAFLFSDLDIPFDPENPDRGILKSPFLLSVRTFFAFIVHISSSDHLDWHSVVVSCLQVRELESKRPPVLQVVGASLLRRNMTCRKSRLVALHM